VCLCCVSSPADSTFEALAHRSPAEWRKSVQVVFTNEQGVEESGIDGGGLFKEFVDLLLKDMFSPPALPPSAPLPLSSSSSTSSTSSHSEGGASVSAAVMGGDIDGQEGKDKSYRNLFLTTATGLLVPNPAALLASSPSSSQASLEQYLFMGQMLGKAVYEEILVEPQFAGMFLNHLLGRTNFIDDLGTLDQEVSRAEMHVHFYVCLLS
jgi:hypothetical protein